jgi:hypothetical protein
MTINYRVDERLRVVLDFVVPIGSCQGIQKLGNWSLRGIVEFTMLTLPSGEVDPFRTKNLL